MGLFQALPWFIKRNMCLTMASDYHPQRYVNYRLCKLNVFKAKHTNPYGRNISH